MIGLVAVDLMRLPKAELHLHIEGTLEPETVMELAARNGVALPYADEAALRAAYSFGDLQEFLDLYYAAMATLQRAEDFHLMASRYYERAAEQGVVHAEIFLDPQAHLHRGIPFDVMLDGIGQAVAEAERDHGITGGIIACFLRDQPVADALATYEQVLARRERFLGIGLDSAERPYPPELFVEVYERAGRDGFRRVAHAGEEGPASFVSTALDELHVDRVDHGVHAADDPALVARLAASGTPLTVCPLSNIALKGVTDLRVHPLLGLLAAGVRVTVNSDDPAYFGGYVGDNFVAMRAAGMTDEQAIALARNSIEATFASPERKRQMYAALDAFVAG